MSTPSRVTPDPQSKTLCRWGPGARDARKIYQHEIAAYLRALPHLLEEGHAGQHVLVKGDKVIGTWKTEAEAIHAGREQFGLESIFVKVIDPRDPERFGLLETPEEPGCQR
jgi:hypothetical protein